MLGWRYCGGFSAHNRVRVIDREGRIKLAGYMIRAPMSLEKMTYDDRRKLQPRARRAGEGAQGASTAKTLPAAEVALSEFATRTKALGWGRGPTLPCGRGSSAKSTKPIPGFVPKAKDPCA